jgi:hypothetical protein
MLEKIGKKWTSLNTVGKVLAVVIIIYVYTFLRRLWKRFFSGAGGLADDIANKATAGALGIPVYRVRVLNGYANSLQYALWDYYKFLYVEWAYRMDEDEDLVYLCLNDCRTAGEVAHVAKMFMLSYPDSLPEQKKISLALSIKKLMSENEISKINNVAKSTLGI